MRDRIEGRQKDNRLAHGRFMAHQNRGYSEEAVQIDSSNLGLTVTITDLSVADAGHFFAFADWPTKLTVHAVALSETQPSHVTEEQIEEYLFGRLPEGTRTNLEHHVSKCAACIEKLHATREFVTEIRRLLSTP
jgi:hypothetical protein